MTELLSELRRSPVAGDGEVAELLDALRPAAGSRPRASETLAAFISERDSGVTPPAELRDPAEGSSLLVVLGSASEPRPARPRVLIGMSAQAIVAAAIALVAVVVATGGPPRDVVVRPTDSSSTVAPATTAPADQADPTPRRHPPVAPGVASRRNQERTQTTGASGSTSGHTASSRTSTPAVSGEDNGRDTEDQIQESGDDHGDETASGTDDRGGERSDGDGGGAESPDGSDD